MDDTTEPTAPRSPRGRLDLRRRLHERAQSGRPLRVVGERREVRAQVRPTRRTETRAEAAYVARWRGALADDCRNLLERVTAAVPASGLWPTAYRVDLEPALDEAEQVALAFMPGRIAETFQRGAAHSRALLDLTAFDYRGRFFTLDMAQRAHQARDGALVAFAGVRLACETLNEAAGFLAEGFPAEGPASVLPAHTDPAPE